MTEVDEFYYESRETNYDTIPENPIKSLANIPVPRLCRQIAFEYLPTTLQNIIICTWFHTDKFFKLIEIINLPSFLK